MIYRKKAKKTAKKLSQKIHDYLCSDGLSLEDYCICGDLIYTVDRSDGRLWVHLIENDDFALACVEWLKMNGVKDFIDDEDLEDYSKLLRDKNIKTD